MGSLCELSYSRTHGDILGAEAATSPRRALGLLQSSVLELLCQEGGQELPFSHSALGSSALCYRFDQEGAYL